MIEHFYSSPWLDRAAERRTRPEWIAEAWESADTGVLAVRGGRSLVDGRDPIRAVAGPSSELGIEVAEDRRVFLGLDEQERVWFVALLDPAVEPAPGRFEDLRSIGPMLDARAAGLLAYARGIATWHDTHRYCGACGSPTRSEQAGWLRICGGADCARQHFPRTDPAIIVRVVHGDRILLGRQPNWPPRWYSVLAGFVEPGESLEEAVRREVREETTIECDQIVYDSSQPWPFPASLMVGFSARALTTDIDVAGDELEDARWFSAAEIAAGRDDGSLRLSPRVSISRHLIDRWLERAATETPSATPA